MVWTGIPETEEQDDDGSGLVTGWNLIRTTGVDDYGALNHCDVRVRRSTRRSQGVRRKVHRIQRREGKECHRQSLSGVESGE